MHRSTPGVTGFSPIALGRNVSEMKSYFVHETIPFITWWTKFRMLTVRAS